MIILAIINTGGTYCRVFLLLNSKFTVQTLDMLLVSDKLLFKEMGGGVENLDNTYCICTK